MNDPRKRIYQDGSHSIFYNLTLEVTNLYFYHILLVTQTNLGTVWGRNIKGCGYQEVWIFGNHLEAGYHKCPEQCLTPNRYLFICSCHYSPCAHRLAGKTRFGHEKRELGKVDCNLNWAMLSRMMEEGLQDQGVEIREGRLAEVELRGQFSEETEGECGTHYLLPSRSQSPFLLPVARRPATRMIQALHGKAFLFASE